MYTFATFLCDKNNHFNPYLILTSWTVAKTKKKKHPCIANISLFIVIKNITNQISILILRQLSKCHRDELKF